PVQQAHDFLGELRADLRDLELDDIHLALGVGKIDVQMQTAALQRVGHLAAVVAGEHHQRNVLRLQRADLGHGNLKVAENFQQERFELGVGLVDLVDQQHAAIFRQERAQQRARQQKAIGEK